MNWQEIKGINFVADFSGIYLENGPINRRTLFSKPDREKYGYLWELNTEQLTNIGNIGESLFGFLITSDLDARVILGLYNRVFYTTNKDYLLSNNYPFKQQKNSAIAEENKWLSYKEALKRIYASDYLPVKRFLNNPVDEKIWIPLFPGFGTMDTIARKGYYEIIKWIVGNKTSILELPNKYERNWLWSNVILEEGPMENPELHFLEDFAIKNASSIRYMPKKIIDKLDLEFLGQAGDLGIF